MTWLLCAAAVLVLLFLAGESALHARRLRRIPIRIHVNGTRGKTTVTRLVAAALRQAGIRTMAKVTGDEPLLILPDGTEQPIRRRGPPRIGEQMWFVRQAAAAKVEAVVVECMALAPALQQISEERMIRSTVGVITNVRPDHFEVMGEDLDAVAAALAGTIPRQGVLVTADRKYAPQFEAWAAAKGSRVVLATGAEEQGGLMPPEVEHAAIVREVGAALQLPLGARAVTVRAAPGVWRWASDRRSVCFVDAFSANDPVSTALRVASMAAHRALPGPRVALLNNRADRPRRLLAFAAALRDDRTYAAVALGGDLTRIARRGLGKSDRKVFALAAREPANIMEEIGQALGVAEFTVVGMGNAKGLGLACVDFFAEKGLPCP